MQGTGYLDRQQRHPGFLTAAIVLHVGILGAILAYHPEVFVKDGGSIILRPIAGDPPPPIHPKPRPQHQRADPDPRPQQPPDITRTIIDIPTGTGWPPLPPEPPVGSGAGDGGTQVVLPPEPVLTAVGLDPRFAGVLQPPYPAALERAEIEGSVTVRVQIGPDGRVTAVEPVRADDPAFFASTRDWALKRWRFRPATRDGVPIAAWITKTVRFQITR